MARPLRIEYPGAVYHVTSRGNARQKIYADDRDRKMFLDVLDDVVDRFRWLCRAYCLMDNHYHLVLETPYPNLSKGMRQLNGVYTQRFNRRHRRVGHIFQGRFKAIVVDRDSYLLELCRYVVLNPVRAGRVQSPEHYRWSSYPATAGTGKKPLFLTADWVLSQFGKNRGACCRKYRAFIGKGIGTPSLWDQLRGQVVLGTESFLKQLAPRLKGKRDIREVPRVQRLMDRPSLEAVWNDKGLKTKSARDDFIRQAHRAHGYTLKDIADHLGLHYTTISKVVNAKK